MTQEEKDLLIKDLCARLPYGVILNCCNSIGEKLVSIEENGLINHDYDVDEAKPYLFPLSSMTEEQKEELEDMNWSFDDSVINNIVECLGNHRQFVAHLDCFALIDWLNKNHFDYRGLIDKSLALDATGLNIY